MRWEQLAGRKTAVVLWKGVAYGRALFLRFAHQADVQVPAYKAMAGEVQDLTTREYILLESPVWVRVVVNSVIAPE